MVRRFASTKTPRRARGDDAWRPAAAAMDQERFEVRPLIVVSVRIRAAKSSEKEERELDQHRGRGQQQITVKHVTVNADQAVVTDQVLSGGRREDLTAALLPATTDRAMEIIEPMRKELVGIQRGGSERK